MSLALNSLSKKRILVAGACGYIGKATCQTLADLGAHLVCADLDQAKCEEFANRLNEQENKIHCAKGCDFTNPEDVSSLAAFCQQTGGLNAIVHCIGLTSRESLSGYALPLDQQSIESWSKALEVNLTSAFSLAKSFEGLLMAEEGSSFVMISSIYGVSGPRTEMYDGLENMWNPCAYGASKGGMIQLMRYLAVEWAPKIRVNCVSPGGVAEHQPELFVERYIKNTPLRRMANPQEIADPIAFLISDGASYITGQNLIIDGGWTIW